MKKTKLNLILAGLAITSGLLITSCQKKTTTTTPTPTTNNSTTSSTNNNTAQQHSQDITNIGSEGIENNNGTLSTYRLANGGSLLIPNSTSVTVNINTSAKNMTVTFNNYVGYDLHTRNGTIYYDWSASTNGAVWYRDSGMVLNISTPNHDYSVDGYTVNINSKTVKNIGRINGKLTWTDNSNITILKPASAGSGTIQWQGNWSIALLNTVSYTYTAADGSAASTSYPGVFHGYGGPATNFINWSQALLSVSGTFGGTASDGSTYTGNISSSFPLIANFNCTPMYTKYLYVAGTLNFTPTGQTTRTINYGTGTCDLTYTVSIGSYSITITI